MRVLMLLSTSAFFVLSAAAIWLGGLNQDEGWYLYAANLVAEGKMPYRDFFYTQGPLLPLVYSAFGWVWGRGGILAARVFTWLLGAAGILIFAALARRLAAKESARAAGWSVFVLLGCNLYHLYYVAMPKTYALATLFVAGGFLLQHLARSATTRLAAGLLCAASGFALAGAAGTRISLGALLAVVGLDLLFSRRGLLTVAFALGGFLGLGLAYGPILADASARAGLFAAQHYHAARGGFDIVWTVGSFSRLVRWYLPVLVLLGFACVECRDRVTAARAAAMTRGDARFVRLLIVSFLAVFAVQMLAPFPYEDYQVPIIGLVTVAAACAFLRDGRPAHRAWAILWMTTALSFGSPLLERWMTNGQDRFWSLKKEKTELAQLREVARTIETLDPGGKELLTQDLYLAIETGRKVPAGLEMGPFSILSDAEWRRLLDAAPCPLAALSGYTFAIEPPVCNERPIEQQMEYWSILKRKYDYVMREERFGQNATTLLILRRK